jgi:hypothetical protein
VQLCKHAENLVSSSLPACRDTTCTEPRIEACITCTCTNFGPQKMGRKSNVGAHNKWGVPIKVLTLVNNAPWCAVRKSLFYPPSELHGHHGSAWRVIKSVPLVADFTGRVYVCNVVLPFDLGFHVGSMVLSTIQPNFSTKKAVESTSKERSMRVKT